VGGHWFYFACFSVAIPWKFGNMRQCKKPENSKTVAAKARVLVIGVSTAGCAVQDINGYASGKAPNSNVQIFEFF
jgi:hypothetical protein